MNVEINYKPDEMEQYNHFKTQLRTFNIPHHTKTEGEINTIEVNTDDLMDTLPLIGLELLERNGYFESVGIDI